jgi:hypothetical protein
MADLMSLAFMEWGLEEVWTKQKCIRKNEIMILLVLNDYKLDIYPPCFANLKYLFLHLSR